MDYKQTTIAQQRPVLSRLQIINVCGAHDTSHDEKLLSLSRMFNMGVDDWLFAKPFSYGVDENFLDERRA